MNTNNNTSEGATVLLLLMFALSMVAGVGFFVFSLEKSREDFRREQVRQLQRENNALPREARYFRSRPELLNERELPPSMPLENGALLATNPSVDAPPTEQP